MENIGVTVKVSNSIKFELEKQEDGRLVCSVSTKSHLLGKKAVFFIKKKVSVKDKRPVHDDKTLFEKSFILKGVQKIVIPATVLSKASPSFPYSGSKISVLFEAEIEIRTLLFFKHKSHVSLSNFVASDLPKRARVKNNASELMEPKDTFKFFKNLLSLSKQSQANSLTLLLFGGASAMFNLYVGYHDQMVPEAMTWFYSHYDSDRDSSSPLFKAIGVSTLIGFLAWLGVKKEFQKYMSFHFKKKLTKINRSSTIKVCELISGRSRVDLFDATLRIVACNLEKGECLRGYGSNQRTVQFSHPNRAVLLYSKKVPVINKGEALGSLFMDEVSFKPMFDCLYPRQMISDTHGLDLAWEVQLLVDDFVDQELLGDPNAFVQKEFYTA
tara:strand:+ start:170 stop:1321 length:1152 start_codon:yes stop_codon:yes gene_type:complete